MSVTVPALFTPMFNSEFALDAPVSEEALRKLGQNINMLSVVACPGQIRLMLVNIPGVPIPAADQFQLCDGSTIADSNSPLNGFTTPSFLGSYIITAAAQTTNNSVGAASINLEHKHVTLNFSYTNPDAIGADGDNLAVVTHNHAIADDLVSSFDLTPVYMAFAVYIKIN